MDRDLSIPFRDFVELFEQLEIPYVLIGGLAVSVHGIPRPTHDLDFTISLDRSKIGQLFQKTVDMGYSVPEEFDMGWVDHVAGMPLIRIRKWLRGKSIDVDIFLAESRFQSSMISRRVRVEVDDVVAWVATPEDLILLKLIAARPRDIGDIMDILLAQGKLDEAYLQYWAKELAVLPVLASVMNDMQF